MGGEVILSAHPILTESRVTLRALRLVAPLLFVASPLAAQYLREVGSSPAPKTLVGINLQLGVPQGEFRNFVGTGGGLGGNITFFLDRGRHAGLRIWGSWIEYGSMTVAAQRSRRTIEDLVVNTPADGMLAGVGSINGEHFGEEAAQANG